MYLIQEIGGFYWVNAIALTATQWNISFTNPPSTCFATRFLGTCVARCGVFLWQHLTLFLMRTEVKRTQVPRRQSRLTYKLLMDMDNWEYASITIIRQLINCFLHLMMEPGCFCVKANYPHPDFGIFGSPGKTLLRELAQLGLRRWLSYGPISNRAYACLFHLCNNVITVILWEIMPYHNNPLCVTSLSRCRQKQQLRWEVQLSGQSVHCQSGWSDRDLQQLQLTSCSRRRRSRKSKSTIISRVNSRLDSELFSQRN